MTDSLPLAENRPLRLDERRYVGTMKNQLFAVIDLLEKVLGYISEPPAIIVFAEKLTTALTLSPETLNWALNRLGSDTERQILTAIYRDPTRLAEGNRILAASILKQLQGQLSSEYLDPCKRLTEKYSEIDDLAGFFQAASEHDWFFQTISNNAKWLFASAIPPIPVVIDSEGKEVRVGDSPMLTMFQIRTALDELVRVADSAQQNLTRFFAELKRADAKESERRTEEEKARSEQQRHDNSLREIRTEKRWAIGINLLAIVLAFVLGAVGLLWGQATSLYQEKERLRDEAALCSTDKGKLTSDLDAALAVNIALRAKNTSLDANVAALNDEVTKLKVRCTKSTKKKF
jgi:hypothetical protein